jgi:hypothetical protein
MGFCIRLAAKQCNNKSLNFSKLINNVTGGIGVIGVMKVMTNCALWNWRGVLPDMVVTKEY